MIANRLTSFPLVLLTVVGASAPLQADPLSPAFTYQGRLTQGGSPVNGTVNLAFSLYDAATGGAQIGAPALVFSQPVQDGLFTASVNSGNEFGSGAFNGDRRWLAISVNGGPALSPRQELTVTPNARFAASTPWTGIIGVPSVALLNAAQTFTAMQTFSAGATTNAFKLSSGPQPGYVMTSDAAGNGTWQAVPPAPIPTPLTLSASVSGSHVIEGDNLASDAGSVGVRGRGVVTGVLGDAIGGAGSVGVQGNGSTGVSGATSAIGGVGVLGVSPDTGMRGVANGPFGGVGVIGVYAGSANEAGVGVSGTTNATANGTVGVLGQALALAGTSYGGYFSSASPSGTGIKATSQLGGWAGRFEGSNGVYISASSNMFGLQVASGMKSAVVRTRDGARALYCEEATEVWFADYGTGQLDHGRATVRIDPMFGETVELRRAYYVFVQVEGECEGVYVVNKTPEQFEVVELRDGRSPASFSYRLVAKRRGSENMRMERAPHADDDPNLYPEKRADSEARRAPLPAAVLP